MRDDNAPRCGCGERGAESEATAGDAGTMGSCTPSTLSRLTICPLPSGLSENGVEERAGLPIGFGACIACIDAFAGIPWGTVGIMGKKMSGMVSARQDSQASASAASKEGWGKQNSQRIITPFCT
ncbi:hypothetical protein B0H14DRAFT_2565367 [Mycena olivaceomarginata]|nr:hypothetical protein B0H14DRAFT_2565367 [Mycena olivaceomarginata]